MVHVALCLVIALLLATFGHSVWVVCQSPGFLTCILVLATAAAPGDERTHWFSCVRSCWFGCSLGCFPHGRRSLLGLGLRCRSARASVWVAACSFSVWVCLSRFLHGRRSLLGFCLSCPSTQAPVWVAACPFVFRATFPLRSEYSRIVLSPNSANLWARGWFGLATVAGYSLASGTPAKKSFGMYCL